MTKPVRAVVEQIPDDAWTAVADYPDSGEAQIAQTTLQGRRLIVRRVRTLGAQGELFADWKHYPFATNRAEDIALVEAEHRDHAVVEQVIADLEDQALAHFPSGHFNANGSWTVLAALAHNLLRWTQLLGLPDTTVRAARTLRRRPRNGRADDEDQRPNGLLPRRRLTARFSFSGALDHADRRYTPTTTPKLSSSPITTADVFRQ